MYSIDQTRTDLTRDAPRLVAVKMGELWSVSCEKPKLHNRDFWESVVSYSYIRYLSLMYALTSEFTYRSTVPSLLVHAWFIYVYPLNKWFLISDFWQITPHDNATKWNHFPLYWHFVRGIHRSPVNSHHKGQGREALIFPLICAWINGWVNNGEAGEWRRHRAHYDVIVMVEGIFEKSGWVVKRLGR